MIVTVTLNPALDLTYAVDALVPHGTHRVARVTERPGGKGLNVARVLHALGEPVLATGLLGGVTGDRVATLLGQEGVRSSFVRIAAETRRTVAVVDPADATGFWEPGPTVTPAEWSLFVAEFRELLGPATVVALSGSLPPGVPIDGYATLIALANAIGVPTVLDTSGPALRAGLAAGPTLAKPNTAELAALLSAPTVTALAQAGPAKAGLAQAERAQAERAKAGPAQAERTLAERAQAGPAQAKPAQAEQAQAEPAQAKPAQAEPGGDIAPGRLGSRDAGPEAGRARRPGPLGLADAVRGVAAGPVVVSRGTAGLLAITADEVWECVPPAPVDGNPTGAGDACVAALARGLRDHTPWPDLLPDAVALSAAAVAAPVAGAFDPDVYRRTRATVSAALAPATPAPPAVGGTHARIHR